MYLKKTEFHTYLTICRLVNILIILSIGFNLIFVLLEYKSDGFFENLSVNLLAIEVKVNSLTANPVKTPFDTVPKLVQCQTF